MEKQEKPVRALYCPHGHNVVWSSAEYDECAACGATMTAGEESEEDYLDSLTVAGQCM